MASEYTISQAQAWLGITEPTDEQMATLTWAANRAENAIRRIRQQNTTDEIEARYIDNAVEITIYLYEKRGVDGVTSMSENGISRSWEVGSIPTSFLRQITPKSTIGFIRDSIIDMADYYTKEEIDSLLTDLTDSIETYVEGKFADYYTKSEIDAIIPDTESFATKEYVDGNFYDKATADDTFITQVELSDALDGYVTQSEFDTWSPVITKNEQDINDLKSEVAESGFYNPKPISVSRDSNATNIFVGTVDEWDEVTSYSEVYGIPLVIIPTQNSSSNGQMININGIGELPIRRPGLSGNGSTTNLPAAAALNQNVAFSGFITQSTTGTIFLATSITHRSLGGADFAHPVSVNYGGTGGNSAVEGLTNLGGVNSSQVQNLIDTTVKHYLDLGDGENIPSGVDLNTYTTPGTYTCLTDGASAEVVNAPTSDYKFRCYVSGSVSGSGNAVAQLALIDNTDDNIVYMLARVTQDGNTWSSWAPVGGSTLKLSSEQTQTINSNVALGLGYKLLGTDQSNVQHEIIGINEYTIDGNTYEQTEVGSTGIHLNLNTNNDPTYDTHVTCDTEGGTKETVSYQSDV